MAKTLFTLIMALVFLTAPAAWAQTQCPFYTEGEDYLENTGVKATLEFQGRALPVRGEGPTLILKGTPFRDPLDGRCTQPIQMVDMQVTAPTPFGDVFITTHPNCTTADPNNCDARQGCSCGIIKEQNPGTGFPANSQINVSVLVDGLPTGEPLTNYAPDAPADRQGQPARVQARITRTPPRRCEDYAEELLRLRSLKTGIEPGILIRDPIHQPEVWDGPRCE